MTRPVSASGGPVGADEDPAPRSVTSRPSAGRAVKEADDFEAEVRRHEETRLARCDLENVGPASPHHPAGGLRAGLGRGGDGRVSLSRKLPLGLGTGIAPADPLAKIAS